MGIDKFWIVAKINHNQGFIGQKKHNTLNEATKEASRLAIKENAVFYVLECMGAAQPSTPPVEWVVADEKEIF